MSDAFAVDVHDGVIHVSGDLDAQTSPAVDEVISAMLADGAQELVFDLGALDFLDSSGLRSMVLARGPQGDGRVVLRSPSSAVSRLLEITGLSEVFVVEP